MKRALVVASVALLVFASACGSSSKPKTRPAQGPIDFRDRTAVDVSAENNLFTPQNIVINVGTTVTWHNNDQTAHNVKKAADIVDFGGPFGVDIQAFGPGASYSFTFTKAGVFPYTCTIHSFMTGSVQVMAATGASSTSTSTGTTP